MTGCQRYLGKICLGLVVQGGTVQATKRRQEQWQKLKCQLQLLCYHIQTRRRWESSLTRLSSYDRRDLERKCAATWLT